MKQKFYTSGLFVLVMLSACILTGCSDDEKNDSTKGNGKKSFSVSADMSGWPDDLPKFTGGKLFHVLNKPKTGVLTAAVFHKINNPETAYKNYKTALTNKGWVLEDDRANESTWFGNYEKGEKNVTFTIQKDGSVAQLFYFAD